MRNWVQMFLQIWISTVLSDQRHGAKILQQPRDVSGASCDDDIVMTCLATGNELTKTNESAPTIEWWYRNTDNFHSTARKLFQKPRISIKIETFVTVQSTLTIHNAKLTDQGVYQCRSSASPHRYEEGINVYQHWKIEEAPITNMKCSQKNRLSTTFLSKETTSHTISIPYSSNPQAPTTTSNLKRSATSIAPTTTVDTKKSFKRRNIKRQPKRSSHPSNMPNSSESENGSDLDKKRMVPTLICLIIASLFLP